MKLFRQGMSHQQIARELGRNHSSVGYIVRREDMREEAALVAAEESGTKQ